MTVTPQGSIYLCKTPLENDYKNTLTFSSTSEQQSYFNSKVLFSFDNYTYLKKENSIKVFKNIDEIINCNYLFYNNGGFTSKIYYCFITSMEYINENVTLINIETDVYQTWMFNINYNPSFIEREHVNDDSVGLHTVPENLETGSYWCNSRENDPNMDEYTKDLCFVMASTSEPVAGDAKDTVAPSAIYNGIYTGLTYYRYDVPKALDLILEIFAGSGKTDAINGVFMCPKWLAPLSDDTYRSVKQSNSPLSYDFSISKQTSLNLYTPKNNKLLCYPYNYLLLSNNIGQNSILKYERFASDSCTFKVRGVINPGCSISIVPTLYNGLAISENDSIQLGKFPICNFQNDMYTNWLTQNSINILGQTITSDDMNIVGSAISGIVSTATSIGAGSIAGAGVSAASGLSGVASALITQKQHNMIPPTVNGQLNSADVNVASGNNTFHFYKMSVNGEYAKIIDNYFSMYGYKVNTVKAPNITGRRNWNFVKTINCNFDGDIPQNDMIIIKQIFDNGITLWHNPNTIFDYTQNNSII